MLYIPGRKNRMKMGVFLFLFVDVLGNNSSQAIEFIAAKMKSIVALDDIVYWKNPPKKHKKSGNADRSQIPVTMDVKIIANFHGYHAEEHKVVTEDGYIIYIHRIPYGITGPHTENRQPVIVQHGFLCSSTSWFINNAENALPYVLANEGYDVWISNVRGTYYGREHVSMSPESNLFWKFSFQEMAQFDIPAIIDYILEKTRFPQVYYIGHSMGTTISLAMLSTRTEYNNKVKAVFELGPAASFKYMRTPVRHFHAILKPFFKLRDPSELVPEFVKPILSLLITIKCDTILKILCQSFLFVLTGSNTKFIDADYFPLLTYTTKDPSTSTGTLLHLAQIYEKGRMAFYDMGFFGNIQRYNKPYPPDYDLSKITAPVGLFWGPNDLMTDGRDAIELSKKLQNVFILYEVPEAEFGHLDFMWANNVKRLLFDKMVVLLKDFDSGIHNRTRNTQ